MRNVIVLACAACLVGGCNQGLSGADAGRYQVVQAGERTILLDTEAGRAWELKAQNGVTAGWAPIQSLK